MCFRFFVKLLATNYCTLIWRNISSYRHDLTDVSRKRHVSLQNRYQNFISDYDNKTMRENFFKDQLFWFLEHTQDFKVIVSGGTGVKGL